jgi:phage baseplate assembly protein W
VRQKIRLILLTNPGGRVMLPDFGGGLMRFVFQRNTAPAHRLIQESVSQSLIRWEPRVCVGPWRTVNAGGTS